MSETRYDPTDTEQMRDLVEECVFAFERDVRDGVAARLDTYLPPGEDALRRTILVELVKVDLEFQWKNGTRPSLREYCDAYPELGSLDEVPPDLVYEAYLVAHRHGAAPSLTEFCEAHPAQRDAVFVLAQQTLIPSANETGATPPAQWQVGMCFDDFILVAVIGQGAFGKVFLAQQMSLGRQVALKITANLGREARTMATLEHDHIVQVFSETVLPAQNLRLLCMQFVPGTTLGKIINNAASQPERRELTGPRLLELVDDLSTVRATLDAASLPQREQLAAADVIETVVLLGRQLAGALAFAHGRGVLHRDIKPDNILISQYGRPLLVDFNLSKDARQAGDGALFGGSLAYMAPEHLEAFQSLRRGTEDVVDARSDLYSLGVVLFELLYQRRPYPDPPRDGSLRTRVAQLAVERRLPMSHGELDDDDLRRALDRVIRRCLEPLPERRFQSASELVDALEAAGQLHSARKSLPAPGRLLQFALRHPLPMLVLAALVPNLVGSLVNIAYNSVRIGSYLTAEQMSVFQRLLVGYNLPVYATCIALLVWRSWPIFFRCDESRAGTVRRRIATLPNWIVGLCALGWLPGGVVFPLVLHVAAGPLPWNLAGHFVTDFVVSGLIAVTYSYFCAEVVLLRVLYPRYLTCETQPCRVAQRELRRVPGRIRAAQVAAGSIPLLAATLLVAVGPAAQEGYRMFQLLVIGLIVLGMLGFCVSLVVADRLLRTVHALTMGH